MPARRRSKINLKECLLTLPIKRLFLPALAILALIAMIPRFLSKETTKPAAIEWIKMPGSAVDIDISMDGDAWIASTNGSVHMWDGDQWQDQGGSAVRIAAGPGGNIWSIDRDNRIFRWHQGDWLQMPGAATDIAIGASGAIWMLGTDKAPGGLRVYKWGVVDWVAEDNAGMRIAVGPKGNPWIVNDKKEILRLTRQVWKKAPGTARDIAIAANGVSWILGPPAKAGQDGPISAWGGKNWIHQSGALRVIATDARSYPWGINAQNEIFADARSSAIKRK